MSELQRGERGPRGDHGQTGDKGATGGRGVEGPPGGAVIVHQRSPFASVLWAAAALCFTASMLVALIASRVDSTNAAAELRAISDDRARRAAQEDCRILYEDDIEAGIALSQIALADLFIAVVDREPPVTAEEQAAARAENTGYVAELNAANEPLRVALAALDEYRLIDPPPEFCPHPQARNGP